MSQFLDKQKNECEELEEIVEEKICPTCIPNPFAPTIDWLTQEEPYFDEKTCEYIIRAIGHKVQDVFINGIMLSTEVENNTFRTKRTFDNLRQYASYFKDNFTKDLLRHYNKDITEETVKLSVIPEQGIIVNSNSLINFKVSIPAEAFNNISGAPTPEQLEDKPPAEAIANLPSTVNIDDEEYEFGLNLLTTKMGITSYELRYCYYRNVNKGVITYDIEDQVRFFKPKDIKESLTEFKEALDRLLSQNGMGFYNLTAAFFPIYDVVTKVEIELDNSDENKPMAIKKVFATSGMCPRKEMLKGIDIFKEKGYIPQALFFISNFDSAFSDITAEEPKEWLEFFEEYTYPPIKASISTSEQVEIEESAGACALDLDIGKLAEGLLEDFLIDFWDTFSHQFNIDSCKDDIQKREPALKQSLNPNIQEQRELLYKEELKKLRQERDRKPPELPNIDDAETHQEGANLLNERTQRYREQVQEFENELREQAMQNAEARLQKMDKDQFRHPFFKHFKNSLKKRIKDDQSIISIFHKINQEDIPSSQKTQKFINTIGICGITKGFRDALGCLTKQVDFGTLIKSTVKTFLQGLGVDNLNEALASLLVGLPPEKQIEVTMKIEQQFGKIKPPWESGNTTDLDKQQAKKEQAQLTALAAHPDKDISNVPQAGESEFTRGVQQGVQASYDAIITAYLEAILGASTPDELIAKYKKKIPALAFILDRIDKAKCPTEPEKDIKNKKIKKFNFDICDPTLPPINFKIPKFTFKPNLFLSIKANAKKALREAIMKAIAALVHKLITILEEKLCDFLSALGKAGFNLLTGEPVDFDQILKDAFCPDASEEEIRDLGNKLLNTVGVKDTDVQSAFDCFTGAILGTMTQTEMLDLITQTDKNPQDLRLFVETIKVGCPSMFDLVNTPGRASSFLNSIGNLIPEDIRNQLAQTPTIDDELPFFNSICLTSAELDAWNNFRRSRLENNGLPSEDAAEQMDIFNQRAQDALEDALDAINNGPSANLEDLLRDLVDALPEIEGCELKDGESNAGNKLFREPAELVKVQDEISNRIFDNIIDVNSRDLFKKPIFGSLIEKILSDTEGNHKGFHTFLDGFLFTQLMYHDYDGAYEMKLEKLSFLEKLFDFSGGEPGSGFYPDTVGNSLKNQIIAPSQYTSTNVVFPRRFQRRSIANIDYEHEIIPARQAPSYAKQFLRTVKVTEVTSHDFKGSVGFVSSDLTSFTDNLDYKIISECPRIGLFLSSTQKIDAEDLLVNLPASDNIEIRNTVFDKFIQDCLTDLQYSPNFSSTSNYENFISLVFDETISSVMNKSDCFNFGFLQETLTEDDLRYVDPEPGSEEYTYEESDEVLGRSYTNSDRVFFLSPEDYGGTYEVPPVYIVPKKMTGWLGLSQALFPDEEECEVKSENIFGASDIKKFVNNRRNSMVSDDKLKKLNDKCYFDKPFDKVLSRNASSSIEGVIKIALRSKIVKEFIKSLPVLSCLKMTDQNYDRSITELILQKITSELKIVDPLGPRDIEKENYYLLFLEQCYQSYEKRFIEKLPKIINPDTGLETDEYDFTTLGKDVEDAYKKISLFRENFSYENANTESDIEVTLLKGQILDHTILEREDFGALAGSYQKLGNKMLTSSDSYTYKKPLFQSERVTNLFSVLLAIKLCEKEALVILREMIFKELEEITEKFHKTYDPIITDINRYILTNGANIFLDNKIQEYGTHLYNQKRDVGSVTSLGAPEDVVDVVSSAPFPEETAEKMKIEKYIRIKEKTNHDLPLEVTEILDSRDHNLRDVVSLENLQQFFSDNIEVLGEYYITDLFGDAELTPIGEPVGDLDQETEITGDIGLSAGLRIVLNLPEKVFIPDEITLQDLELSKKEKCYYCIHENMDASLSFSIPITSVEVFLMDTKIKDLDLLAQYDTHCLLEKIIKTKKYNDLFRKITPIQAATSLALNYCDTFFISSIGQDDGWTTSKMIKDDSKEVSDGAMVCRRYFASFYNSNSYGHSEFLGLPKIEFPDFFKLLFGGFEFPEVNLKFVLPLESQFDHKIIRTNPFDKNGDKCSDK